MHSLICYTEPTENADVMNVLPNARLDVEIGFY